MLNLVANLKFAVIATPMCDSKREIPPGIMVDIPEKPDTDASAAK